MLIIASYPTFWSPFGDKRLNAQVYPGSKSQLRSENGSTYDRWQEKSLSSIAPYVGEQSGHASHIVPCRPQCEAQARVEEKLISRWVSQGVRLETRLVGMCRSGYSYGGAAVSDAGDFRLPTYNI